MVYATKSLAAELFRPSTSLAGNEAPTVIRGANMLLRGPRGNQYFEVHPGDSDLGENYNIGTAAYALTGTIGTTANSYAVTGAGGSLFKRELHPGQLILATNGEVFAVKEVLTNTSFTAYNKALATTSGLTAYRMPQMFEIDRKRGVMLTGNALELRLGHKVAVGSGELFINGAALSASLTATKTLQAAIYRAAQDDYVIRPMGYAGFPPAPTINIVTGGTKLMTPDNKHSFLLSYWSGAPEGTDGYSRACEPVKLDGSNNPIKIVNTTDQFEVDLTASKVNMPTNAKGFVIWKNQQGKATKSVTGAATVTTTSPNDTLYNNGPWLKAAEVSTSSATFTDANVNTTTDAINIANHPFETGDRLYIKAGTTAPSFAALGPAGPIPFDTAAYVIKVDDDNIKLAATEALAHTGIADDITAPGTGTNTIAHLIDGDLYRFDCLDEELYEEYFGDDYDAPDAEFVAKMEDRPVLLSCYGKRSNDKAAGSNPGPLCSMSKFDNPDGFPPDWTAGGQHNIIGYFEGVGRVFLMTPASLDFVTPTGLLGQTARGGLDAELPMIWRPYWKTGAANRYSIVLDDDTLYGRSGGKFIRSIGNGDENVRKYDFGSVVEDVTRDWNDGFAYSARNPKDGQICFVRTACRKNTSGYWESEIWPFSVWADAWLPKVVLTSTTRDMIVCGVATIDERFEYLAGGRVSGGTYQVKTYRFGEGIGSGTISGYVAWQPSDDGTENMSKRIHSIRAQGRLTSPVVQIHGARPDGNISLTNLEDGLGTDTSAFFSGDIALATSTGNKRYMQTPVRISNLATYAVRIGVTWSASDTTRDRLEELVLEVSTHGRTR